MRELMPPGAAILFGKEKAEEKVRRAEFEGKNQHEIANAAARLSWLDLQGIAQQHVICLAGVAYNVALPDLALRQEVIQTCNTWLADVCAKGNGRLLPVSAIDFTDLDLAVRELTRMRSRGSRIFLIPGRPVNGISPAHPETARAAGSRAPDVPHGPR